jgi:hypothetical protein
MNDFVIIYVQRVGSTHLAHFLNQVDGVKMMTRGDNVTDKHYYEPLNKTKTRASELEEFFSENKDTINGCKIPVKHIRTGLKVFLEKKKPKIIFLKRKSTREHVLSMIYARESGIWHNFHGDTLPKKIIASEEVINASINSFLVTQKKILNLKNRFVENDWIDAYYEDIITDKGKGDILSFLGASWDDKYATIENEKKLLTGNYKQYFQNYQYILKKISKIKH